MTLAKKRPNTSQVNICLTKSIDNKIKNQEMIDQTKKFLIKNRRSSWETTLINNQSFQIHPKVFHAGKFPSTAWFATALIDYSRRCSSFCEIGCGAGVIACLLAKANPRLKIVATDSNPNASENTQINAQLLGLTDRISVRQGDVLDAIGTNEQFDLIFWALPFGFLDHGTSITLEESQVFDPGYRAIRKLLHTAREHLQLGGKLLLGFSSDLGHYELLQHIVQEEGASIRMLTDTLIQEDIIVRFEILELSYEGSQHSPP